MEKKRNAIEWAMHYRQIVILVVCCLIAFGIYSLPNMRKNEFPDFTIRQGLVVAVAPGNTVEEMVEQVTKPLEDYIFTYKEVKKNKTYSTTRDGIVYIQVELNDDLNNKDEFWSKFKHGVAVFKSELPQNVLAVQVVDDFGDTSALLITMESEEKTYRELDKYMEELQNRLRQIPSVGRMSVSGLQKEQISVYLDNNRLSQYGLNDQLLATTLFAKGFTTTGGQLKSDEYVQPVYVAQSFNTVYDVEQQIVYTDPSGNNIRLKDIARVVKEYPEPDSYISNNDKKCILLSVEMKKGQNIVKMGNEINQAIESFKQTIPSEVNIYRITDQSQVVDDSVTNFLKELVIAIVAVIIVVMLLLPFRVALVAASTIPITIFISLGLFNAFGIELNTVTLAALIVTLGMIVDNSIVIIDNYLEKISEGQSRWHASIESTTHFLKSIVSATLAISITFFPFLFMTTGMIHDFILSFPWSITLILGISLLVATLLVPFMQFYFIRKPLNSSIKDDGKKKFSFLDTLQEGYNRLLDVCFHWPRTTVALGILSVVAGAYLMSNLPQKLMPTADRNQFAVEITLPTGTAINKTSDIADSLSHILQRDPRVLSVTSFKGCASPRFHTTYAPQIAGTNYAQFIVNTIGNKATEEMIAEYKDKYLNYFPNVRVRFKQLEYSEAAYPIEMRVKGNNRDSLRLAADKVKSVMSEFDGLSLVHDNWEGQLPGVSLRLKDDEMSRLGINKALLSTGLSMHLGNGLPVTTVWDGDYPIDVVLKDGGNIEPSYEDVGNQYVSAWGGTVSVPVRQIADIEPDWHDAQIAHRNGIPSISIQSDVKEGFNAAALTKEIVKAIEKIDLPDGVDFEVGGSEEADNEMLDMILSGLFISIVVIFFILLFHFRRINMALLVLGSISLCLLGAALGIWVMGLDVSVTAVLGIVSLMGILVRNGIIMLDYADELREKEGLTVREAALHSAKRRMRPIFLTSAAASMGVIPMILGGSPLWSPMGSVVFFGTIVSMVLTVTILPVAYWLIFSRADRKSINH